MLHSAVLKWHFIDTYMELYHRKPLKNVLFVLKNIHAGLLQQQTCKLSKEFWQHSWIYINRICTDKGTYGQCWGYFHWERLKLNKLEISWVHCKACIWYKIDHLKQSWDKRQSSMHWERPCCLCYNTIIITDEPYPRYLSDVLEIWLGILASLTYLLGNCGMKRRKKITCSGVNGHFPISILSL